jgi:hypothetical protein
MPSELTAEAHAIVHARAQAAYAEIDQHYPPDHTGNLRAGLQLEDDSEPLTARAAVLSTAPHAGLVEYGSKTIRYTKAGASRGQMPASHTVEHARVAQRAQMYAELAALLDRYDLQTTPGEWA